MKESYGIICYRKREGQYQMLMVKKTTTYAFCEFVNGRYLASNTKRILSLLNGMTHYERMSCLSFSFPMMWYIVYGEYPSVTQPMCDAYNNKHTRFDTVFAADGGYRLRHLLRACGAPKETLWEIPKGRRAYSDLSIIDTATREFNEEIGANQDNYTLLTHMTPFVESYTDMKVIYRNTYYYAIAEPNWEPEHRYISMKQYAEVAAVRWVGWNEINNMYNQPVKRLRMRFMKMMKKVRNAKSKRAAPSH